MIYRLSQTMINLDGTLMIDVNGTWKPHIDRPVSSIQLQSLYLFLHRESKSNYKKFCEYVDKTIKELL